jgi:hypothetical protein
VNEDRLFQLLGAIVETNQAVLKQNEHLLEQNGEFLAFLKERDALVAAHFALRNREIELTLPGLERQAAEIAAHYAALEQFGVDVNGHIKEKAGLQLVRHRMDMVRAQEDQEYAEKRAARKLEELSK